LTRTARRVRRFAPVAAAAALVLALSGCGAGQEAETNLPYDPAGSITQVGEVHVMNVVIVASDDGASAEVVAGLVTNGDPDALVGVTVSDADPVTLDAPIAVPRYTNVSLGPEGNRVFVHGLGGKLGHVVRVTFAFRDAGEGSVDALVSTEEDVRAGA
jgi:hypothetical protein